MTSPQEVGVVVDEQDPMKLVAVADGENWSATLDLISVHDSRPKLISKYGA